eukprot:gene3418-1783_t
MNGQQTLDALQKKVELAGGVRNGSWLVECETYSSSQNFESTSKIFHLLHCSDYPNVSFAALENDTCVVADQGMDSLVTKLKAFYVPRKSGKTEAKGINYDFGDFKIKLGNISQGNNFKGIIIEFEYCACFDIHQSWNLLLEMATSFVDEKQCQVLPAPKAVIDSKSRQYSVADKMLQYVELFKFGKKTTS